MMKKAWLVGKYHFWQEVRKRSFIITVLAIPLVVALTVGIGYLTALLYVEAPATVGYVDEAGLLVERLPSDGEDDGDKIELVAFSTAGDAREALEAGRVDAYYVVPADYRQTREAELVYVEAPSYEAQRYFEDTVRLNLMAGQPAEVIERALSGSELTIKVTAWNREFPASGPDAGIIVPIAGALIFCFLVMTTSGYMMEAVAGEKENRTMEVVISSIAPRQMIAGKIVGAMGIGLLQLVIWVAFTVGAVWMGRSVLEIAWLASIQVNWRDMVLLALVALPTYWLIVALATAVGATLVGSHEAQQAGALVSIPLMTPLALLVAILHDADGALALVLSLCPMTNVLTFAARSVFMEVPAWQFLLAAAIAAVSAAAASWLGGKSLRLSMLRYGQRLRWSELFAPSKRAPAATNPRKGESGR